jgi:hypothetical protein
MSDNYIMDDGRVLSVEELVSWIMAEIRHEDYATEAMARHLLREALNQPGR